MLASNLEGKRVISSNAFIPSLQWLVIVERPAEEAYAPLYAAMLRTSALFFGRLQYGGVGELVSGATGGSAARGASTRRRTNRQRGFDHRLDLKTGDEIEILADEFNKMTEHLREAYTGLERKVAERTKALTVANEKLEEASKHKSQFLANVNHELRTPVSAIIGYARLVLRATEGQISALQRENLQDLLRNAERLLNQIDSLLDFAKIEAGKMEVRPGTGQGERGHSGSHINYRTDLERRAMFESSEKSLQTCRR